MYGRREGTKLTVQIDKLASDIEILEQTAKKQKNLMIEIERIDTEMQYQTPLASELLNLKKIMNECEEEFNGTLSMLRVLERVSKVCSEAEIRIIENTEGPSIRHTQKNTGIQKMSFEGINTIRFANQ